MKNLVVRSASISGYAELAHSLGLEPVQWMRKVGLSLQCLSSPDVEVPARKVYELMELSANASGAADFGLRLARARGLSHFGPLGALVRDEPDIRSALQQIAANMHLHTTCVTQDLEEQNGLAIVRLNLMSDGEVVGRQSVEAAVALLFQLLKNLLGPGWHPQSVQFVHASVASDRPHRAFFGCPVHFSSFSNAVVLRSSELDQPMPGSDKGLRRYSGLPPEALLPLGEKVTIGRIRQAILQALPLGQCSSQRIASSLNVDRRTLHRHLTSSGATFSILLARARAISARRQVKHD